jgi:NodT family efflux transporter outer membrane factor (OMF) lipoprotein
VTSPVRSARDRRHACRLVRLLAPALALLLGACASLRDTPTAPTEVVAVPPQWKGRAVDDVARNPATTPRAPRWSDFADPALDALLADAAHDNADLRVLAARRDAAREAIVVARADLWPQVRGATTAQRTKVARSEIDRARPTLEDQLVATDGVRNPFSRFTAGVEVGWELDVWGRVRKAVESAQQGAAAADFDATALRASVAADLVDAWFVLRTADAAIEVREARLGLLRDLERLQRRRVVAGLDNATEALRTAQSTRNLEQSTFELRQRRDALANRVAVLAGRSATATRIDARPLPADHAPPTVAAALPADVLAVRPDLVAARRRTEAAWARAGEAQLARLPTLSLTAQTGYASDALRTLLRGDALGWVVGPSLTGPLFDGGRLKAQAAIARAEARAATETWRGSVLRALEEVENALAAGEFAAQRIDAATQAEARAVDDTALIEHQRSVGRLSRVDTLQAAVARSGATEARVEARGAQYAAAVATMRALGVDPDQDPTATRPP